MSIDDYLDGLLSGSSEPSRKAIMKLTKLIENFGGIMVKSTERMEDYVDALDSRIATLERAMGVASQTGANPAAAPAQSTAAPSLAAPSPAPGGAPNIASSGNVGTPNLSAAPAPSVDSGSIPAPAGTQGATGGGISSADLMKAASGLQKAQL